MIIFASSFSMVLNPRKEEEEEEKEGDGCFFLHGSVKSLQSLSYLLFILKGKFSFSFLCVCVCVCVCVRLCVYMVERFTFYSDFWILSY